MAFAVKNVSVTLDPINESNTFSSGDYLAGRVTVEVKKEIQVESLFVKAKGKASVLWSERYGQYTTVVYHDKETCYKSLQYFIQAPKTQGADGYSLLTDEAGQSYSNVLTPGTHVYPFTFQIPHQDMPASFKGRHGKVIYFVEAKLCRSMHIPKKAKVQFNYIPKGDMSVPDLMKPQYGSREQEMKFLTSGSVAMNVHTERMGYCLGERLTVRIEVENNSSHSVKPKFRLYQKQSFFAMKKRKLHTNNILKEQADPIRPFSKQTLTKTLTIPTQISVSILNCKVLKVEYRLKVYLKVKLASNPEVKLPLVIFPASQTQNTAAREPTEVHIGFESLTINQTAWKN